MFIAASCTIYLVLKLSAEMIFIAYLLPYLEVIYYVSDTYANKLHIMHFLFKCGYSTDRFGAYKKSHLANLILDKCK